MSSRLLLDPRQVKLTTRSEIAVNRLLPHAHLRKIGAWVFVDHFGPTEQISGMTVAQHPHTGLQTVTWLFSGQIDHRDSLGSKQIIQPGQLNLMTAGTGVAHSERSIADSGELHAAQLWLALPDEVRHSAPAFQHLAEFETVLENDLTLKVFIGELGAAKSTAVVHSPLVGAEFEIDGSSQLKLKPEWEYGILPVRGELEIDGQHIEPGQLLYMSVGGETITMKGNHVRGLLIGGEPFPEPIVMWWNFIGRSHEEIVAMRERWNARSYPKFEDEVGGWLPAPELPAATLKSR